MVATGLAHSSLARAVPVVTRAQESSRAAMAAMAGPGSREKINREALAAQEGTAIPVAAWVVMEEAVGTEMGQVRAEREEMAGRAELVVPRTKTVARAG